MADIEQHLHTASLNRGKRDCTSEHNRLSPDIRGVMSQEAVL